MGWPITTHRTCGKDQAGEQPRHFGMLGQWEHIGPTPVSYRHRRVAIIGRERARGGGGDRERRRTDTRPDRVDPDCEAVLQQQRETDAAKRRRGDRAHHLRSQRFILRFIASRIGRGRRPR